MRRATQSLSEYPGRVEATWAINNTEGAFQKTKLRKTNSNPEGYALEGKAKQDEGFGYINPDPDTCRRSSSESTVEVEYQQPSLSYFAYLGDERNRHRKPFFEVYNNFSRRKSIKPIQNLQMIQENVNGSPTKTQLTNELTVMEAKFDGISVSEFQYTKAIDFCTCMCCVRGLIYHLTKDSDSEGNMELCCCTEPSKNCLIQWSMIGVLTIFMPCLLLYPFLKGGFKIYKHFKRSLKTKEKKEKTVHYKK